MTALDSWLLIPAGFLLQESVLFGGWAFHITYQVSVHGMNAATARVQAYLALQAAVTERPHAPPEEGC